MMKSIMLKLLPTLLLACTALAAGSVTAGGNTGNKDNNYTAAGHGPDWQLTIDSSSHAVHFVAGEQSLNYRYPKTGPSFYRASGATVYRVPNDDHALSIRVTEKACRDSQTGKSHETTVMVILDGRAYYGCGDYAR